ncbi:MAG: response regulator [Reyranellales bacterium]|jgi:CheY-like chemotaxis protein
METAKLVLEFIKVLIWPVTAIWAVFLFRRPLGAVIGKASSLKLPGGIELTVSQAASAVAAGAALGKQAAEQNQPVSQAALEQIATAAARPVAAAAERRKVLWVDDNPHNNTSLQDAFQRLGIEVDNALSTEEAAQKLSTRTYDVIISDMGRSGDPEAGKTLLKHLQTKNIRIPTVIYAGRWAAAHRSDAAALGAALITNDAGEVYSYVVNSIRRS